MSADFGQVLVHRIDVHLRHDDRSADAALRADGSEQVRPFETTVARHARSGAAPSPDARNGPLLTDPGFISKPDLNWLAGSLGRQSGGHKRRKLALKTACSSGLLCGCCGRTEIFRNLSLCSSLPTVRSCSVTEKAC